MVFDSLNYSLSEKLNCVSEFLLVSVYFSIYSNTSDQHGFSLAFSTVRLKTIRYLMDMNVERSSFVTIYIHIFRRLDPLVYFFMNKIKIVSISYSSSAIEYNSICYQSRLFNKMYLYWSDNIEWITIQKDV